MSSNLLSHVLDLFYPNACAGCSAVLLSGENVLCTVCRHNLPLTLHFVQKENDAFLKFYGRVPVEFVAALMYFHKQGIVQQLIHHLKYRGHQEIGQFVGDWYSAELLRSIIAPTFDCVIPVPLHKKRLHERGYNQVENFAKSIATNLNIEYDDTLLVRNVYLKTQATKGRLSRAAVTENIFGISSLDNNTGKHFLVVDDVLTTGATLEACCRELLRIPNTKVSVACMAMSES